jgi:hypothetical protein
MTALRRSFCKRSFRPSLEPLEDRSVPSGNTIISDNAPNPVNQSFLAGVSSGNFNGNGVINFVIFTSASATVPGFTGLVKHDSNGNATGDVFLLDRSNGSVTLVSHAPGSTVDTGNDGTPQSTQGVVSTYGNGKIAFVSYATDLASGVTGPTGHQNVYLYDVVTGQITLVSHAGSTTQRANGDSSRVALSADGNYLAFVSNAPDLPGESGGTAGKQNVFLYNVNTGSITLVSHDSGSATTGGNGNANGLVISNHGGLVTYDSTATDLVAGVTGLPATNIYFYSQAAGNVLVNHGAASATTAANKPASGPVVSGDGNWIAYSSAATNLVTGQVASTLANVFLYQQAGGVNSLVSGKNGSSATPATGASYGPSINLDGSAIAYTSTATDIVPGETVGNLAPQEDVYYFVRTTGLTFLVSSKLGTSTQTADGFTSDVTPPIDQTIQSLPIAPDSLQPFVSPNGRFVVFVSNARDLVTNQALGTFTDGSNQTNSIVAHNVFRWDFHTSTSRLISGLNDSLTTTGVFDASQSAFLDVEDDGEVFYNRVVPPNNTTLNGATGVVTNEFPSVTLTFPADGSGTATIADGSPSQTVAGVVNATVANPLDGQVFSPISSLTAGFMDDASFGLKQPPTVASSTLITDNLLTGFTANGASQATYKVQVFVDVGYVSDRETFTVKIAPPTPPALNQKFVSQVYLDLLGRPVDPNGLAYWSGRLDNGEPRAIISQELTHTSEYFGTVIKPAYVKFLGRTADPGGLSYWTNQMMAGLTDEQLEAGFIASPEYYTHNGSTDKGLVDGIYLALLGRQADPAGEMYWVSQIPIIGRNAVALGFAKSPEREMQHVEDDYMKFLLRSADPGGLAYWTDQFITHGKTNEDLITGFLASDEYFKRATM